MESPNGRPNVLFIAVDDLRTELGCYDNDHVISPNIDRLASQGVCFTRAYCQSGVCNPSRASLMTGLRPDTIRVWDLHTHFRDTAPDVVTLPQHFMRSGYHCGAIGKIYHNDLPDPLSWSEPRICIEGYPYDPDAVYRDDDNTEYLERRKADITAEGRSEHYIDPFGQWYLKASATECPDVPDNAYYDGAQTDVAMDKLGELAGRDEPFFFGVGYYRPHLPFNVPKRYWDMYDRDRIPLAENDYPPINVPPMAMNNLRELTGYTDMRDVRHPLEGKLNEQDSRLLKHGYLASVTYVDAQVGKLLARLEELGIADNTIVVLWGDNGWKLGEHASWCKMTNFETDTRVPLIVRSPGIAPGVRSQFVEFVDVYPTLCQLAGLDVPDDLEGVSVAGIMRDPSTAGKGAARSQFLRSGIWRAPDGRDYMGYTIRTNEYRYVEWFDWESGDLAARELYDHRVDSQENENVVDRPEHAAVAAELSRILKSGE
ncbi:MAG: sulfatase [Phycisphaerae bacterium]|jgi:arylsulfatase A-like enzyme|nr:sulfatase [Phycisphaerae bacterium]